MRCRVVLLIAASGFAFTACGADGPRGVTIERTDSAGIEIVRNLGGDLPLDWTFRRLFALGGESAGPESFYEFWPGYVTSDARGRLYILDADDYRVAVFDSTGSLIRTVGRQGGGPGEFQRPYAVAIDSAGVLAVADGGKGTLVRFASDGSVLSERRLGGALYLGGPVALTRNGIVLRGCGLSHFSWIGRRGHETKGPAGHFRLRRRVDKGRPRGTCTVRRPS